MSQPTNSNGQYVRHVTLPSGRKIEVVYFEPLADEPTKTGAQPADALHICPECDRDLVYPVDWEEASATHWEVELRCPNCEWNEVGTYDQATVDRFDEHLDLGTDALVKDLVVLEVVKKRVGDAARRAGHEDRGAGDACRAGRRRLDENLHR